MLDKTQPYGQKRGTCAGCTTPIWRGTGSLPQGKAKCRPCRRSANEVRDVLQSSLDLSRRAFLTQCRLAETVEYEAQCEAHLNMSVNMIWTYAGPAVAAGVIGTCLGCSRPVNIAALPDVDDVWCHQPCTVALRGGGTTTQR